MGATHVTVAVSNPADPSRRWEGEFLVGTGATDCFVPARALRAIGIQPEGKRVYELADGSEITLDVGIARIEFMGDVVGATIIFGGDDVEPLLGRHGAGIGRHRGRSEKSAARAVAGRATEIVRPPRNSATVGK